jgi:hypothetical protein
LRDEAIEDMLVAFHWKLDPDEPIHEARRNPGVADAALPAAQ